MNRIYPSRLRYLAELCRDYLSSRPIPQLDRWCTTAFKSYTQFGKRDRQWYRDMLFSIIRHGYCASFCDHAFHDMQLRHGIDSPDTSLRTLETFRNKYPASEALIEYWKSIPFDRLLRWVLLRMHSTSADEDRMAGIQCCPGEIDFYRQLDSTARRSPHLPYRCVFHSIPLWFLPQLDFRIQHAYWTQEQACAFCARHDTRPPLWLRFHPSASPEAIITELERNGYATHRRAHAVAIDGDTGVNRLAMYTEGLIDIQDLASQRIGEQVAADNGQRVWDCCAGGGGKTIQIAERMNGSGEIYASDIREWKLKELRKRQRRTGYTNITTVPWDGSSRLPAPHILPERSDWVLIDAPCTGSGTWRRNPDGKYRTDCGSLGMQTATQERLFANASRAVCPGGHLVYATCSWFCDENESMVMHFLDRNPSFRLCSMMMTGSPAEDADTMFVAVLERKNTG
jgi:16S rRNA (cytosine967-C5)-methyltransferase